MKCRTTRVSFTNHEKIKKVLKGVGISRLLLIWKHNKNTRKGGTHSMTLYQKLKRSGNPLTVVQTVISLLESHSPKEVANTIGISVRWVYKLRKRFLESNDINACILKRGPMFPMLNRIPKYIETIVVNFAKASNLGPVRIAVSLKNFMGLSLSPYTVRNILKRWYTL